MLLDSFETGSTIFGTISSLLFALPFVMFWVIFIIVLKTIIQSIKRANNMHYFAQNIINNVQDTKYKDVSKAKLDEFHIEDIGSFKNSLYEIFESFEKAYNSLDYNTMKQISTAQLYENYYTGISLNIKDGKKKVIDDIVRKKVTVFAIDSTSVKQIVQTLITISYISYTIDKNGYIVSGSKENKLTETFEVTFKKEYNKDNFQTCPNCGATVSGKKCDYCRTTIKDNTFKISSIKKVLNEKI